CACRPAPAAQYLPRAEPWLRIVFIRVSSEARKRREVRGCPFPHIPDHLPATEGAVALRTSRNVERSVKRKIQIRLLTCRCVAVPRPRPLHPGEAVAVGAWFANRSRLPLHLGRQSAPGPAAPGLGLVPVDENNRGIWSEDFGAIIPAPGPGTIRFRLPV